MRYQNSFLSFITANYNYNSSIFLKRWIKYNKELIIITLQIFFLLKCKRSNIIPKHLQFNCLQNVSFYKEKSKQRFCNHRNIFRRKILNLEISDNVKKRNTLISLTYQLNRKIYGCLPDHICDKFFYTQGRLLHRFYNSEKIDFATNLNG